MDPQSATGLEHPRLTRPARPWVVHSSAGTLRLTSWPLVTAAPHRTDRQHPLMAWRSCSSGSWRAATAQLPVRREVATSVSAVGLPPDFHFHDLSHTGKQLAAEAGATTRELMHRMGHSAVR